MTIRATLKAIRALGLVCGYVPEYSEFWISRRREPIDSRYYTSDSDDALHTARAIAQG